MPAPKYFSPEFSPYGRYLLNVDERKVEGATYFHDTQHSGVECGIESMPTGSVSRFDNRGWAISRGYMPCVHCTGKA